VSERTYHGDVETLLLLLLVQLGERADGAHLVRLEALRVRARVVHFDHARADVDAYELRDVRRERARDLACVMMMNSNSFSGWWWWGER